MNNSLNSTTRRAKLGVCALLAALLLATSNFGHANTERTEARTDLAENAAPNPIENEDSQGKSLDKMLAGVFGLSPDITELYLSLAEGDTDDILTVVVSDSSGEVARGQLSNYREFVLPDYSTGAPGGSPAESMRQAVSAKRSSVAGLLIGDSGSAYVFGIAAQSIVALGDEILTLSNFSILEVGQTLTEVDRQAQTYSTTVNKSFEKYGDSLNITDIIGRSYCTNAPGAMTGTNQAQVRCSTCTSDRDLDMYLMDRRRSECYAAAVANSLVLAAACLGVPTNVARVACLVATGVIYAKAMRDCNDQLNATYRLIARNYRNCLASCDPFSPPGNIN